MARNWYFDGLCIRVVLPSTPNEYATRDAYCASTLQDVSFTIANDDLAVHTTSVTIADIVTSPMLYPLPNKSIRVVLASNGLFNMHIETGAGFLLAWDMSEVHLKQFVRILMTLDLQFPANAWDAIAWWTDFLFPPRPSIQCNIFDEFI